MKALSIVTLTFLTLSAAMALAEDVKLPEVLPSGLAYETTVPPEKDDEKALAEAARLVNQVHSEKKAKASSKVEIGKPAKLSETEIPAFKNKKAKRSSYESSYLRLIVSFAIVVVMGLAMVLFGKWWSRKYKRNDLNTQIRVMTQHHIGPRKSLMIVRVAGEYILVGVTDHNISMIKTLSLIDDEYGDTAKFSDELMPLEEFEKTEFPVSKGPTKVAKASSDTSSEDFSFGDIKDVVSRKLKEMRSL